MPGLRQLDGADDMEDVYMVCQQTRVLRRPTHASLAPSSMISALKRRGGSLKLKIILDAMALNRSVLQQVVPQLLHLCPEIRRAVKQHLPGRVSLNIQCHSYDSNLKLQHMARPPRSAILKPSD